MTRVVPLVTASAILVYAACGGGSSGEVPDALVTPPFDATDAAPAGLAIQAVAPAGGHTIAIDEQAHYAVTIANAGVQTGTITASLSGSTDFMIESTSCTTLAPGGTCELRLRLVPSVIGAIDAQLAVSATPGGTATGSIHGTGLQKNVLSLVDRIDFRGRAVGQASAPIPVTVTNTGSAATGPLAVALAAGRFSIQSDTCAGQSVPSLGTCTITLVYAPTGTAPLGSGGDFATLTVSGTPGGIARSTVTGYGATILMDEWQHLFPNTAIGSTSAPRTFTLTNTQGFSIGPLTTDTQFVGTSFVLQQDTCHGTTLAPSATCTYAVAFQPTATGLVAGAIYVTAPDVGSLRASASVQYGGTGQ